MSGYSRNARFYADGTLRAAPNGIAFYLPGPAFRELMKGYECDLQNKLPQTKDDLLEYSKYVASSIATFMIYITCYKFGYANLLCKENQSMIDEGRVFGQVSHAKSVSDIVR